MKRIREEKWWELLAMPQAWMLWGIKEIKPNEVDEYGFVSPQGKRYIAEKNPTALIQFMTS